jgi:UDP-glucose 4-epimerase
MDNLSTGRMENISHLIEGEPPAAEFVEGSVLDEALVQRLVGQSDVVVHLAASVGVQLIVRKPLECLFNNVRGTEIVLDAAVKAGGRKVLVASTSEVYGKNAAGPLHEEADRILGSALKSRWIYSTSKSIDEIFAYEYFRERGLPAVIARLFNCSGPRQTGAYGMVIPRFVHQALSGEDITIFGDGTQSRCFCHVRDTVAGLLFLLDTPEAVGQAFNVGSQNETTIRALADLVLELTGSSSGVRYVPYSEAYEPGFEDMERRLPDITKITSLTGWVPTTPLRTIVMDVIEHEMEMLLTRQP